MPHRHRGTTHTRRLSAASQPLDTAWSASYNINVSAFDGRLIRKARVTLHGFIGAHFLPAASKGDPTTDATETFTLTPGKTPKPKFQSVVYAKKLTGVSWIQVDAVTYADGKKWHQTNGSVCRVTPNGFLPVNLTTK